MEFNSFGPAVGRLGSDSSRGGGPKSKQGGLSPPSPLTLTTGQWTVANRYNRPLAVARLCYASMLFGSEHCTAYSRSLLIQVRHVCTTVLSCCVAPLNYCVGLYIDIGIGLNGLMSSGFPRSIWLLLGLGLTIHCATFCSLYA